MTDPAVPPGTAPEAVAGSPPPGLSAAPQASAPLAAAAPASASAPWSAWAFGAVVVVALTALVLGYQAQSRVRMLEQDLVKRQQDSHGLVTEAALLSRQAQESARESAAKLALIEARVAETVLQRSQLEDLIQQLSRSRDENVLADIDAALRVAMQQSALTGSAEPLLAALRQADERLARFNQPRLERVRRAVLRDIDRVKAVALADVSSLSIKLDEAIRMVDELPLLAQPERAAQAAPAAASRPAVAASAPQGWAERLGQRAEDWAARVWTEARALVRVTRIQQPEAMLVAPEQRWFLRENLKLRLLNARLALLSRQFDIAQSDLRDARAALEQYYDRNARRTVQAQELVRQVAAQARQVLLPRPDETLAAVAAVQSGR